MGAFPSPQQHEAILRRGNVLVSAAAGSGKTSVLVERIVREATMLHVPLANIAAITFTELAAGEIRERVTRRLREVQRSDLLADLERAPIGTIHNFCARHLRHYAHAAGVDPDFQVLDETKARFLRRTALVAALDAACADPAVRTVRARYGDARLLGDARNRGYFEVAHEAATQRPDGAVRFVSEALPTLAQADAQVLQAIFDDFLRRYAAAKLDAGGLDFDDLQLRMLDLLANEQVLEQVRRDIACLLVDEFQDTNRVQVAIVDRLAIPETFAVGDEWQSIYRFRKADVSVFRERAAATDVLRMDENYRSSSEVIDTVNCLFEQAFAEEDGSSRYEPVRAMRGAAGVPVELVVAHEPEAEGARAVDVEFSTVARRIRSLIDAGEATAGEIAVLMCASTKAARLREVLARFGVESVTSQSKGFGDQLPVRDVIALLRWVRNRNDTRAAYSVLASPYVGLALQELYALRARDSQEQRDDEPAVPVAAEALTLPFDVDVDVDAGVDAGAAVDAGASASRRRDRVPLWQALQASTSPQVRAALDLREQLASVARERSVVELVSAAIHDSGYAELVLAQPDGRRRYAQLRKLLQLAREAAELGHGDLASFLDLQAAQSDVATDYGEASIADEHTGAVRIMTFHAAKGLEFPHVFVVDCSNTGNASDPRVLVDGSGTVHFETVDAAGLQTGIPDGLATARDSERRDEAMEERRKYYVALTRAQRGLHVSGSLQQSYDRSATAWIRDALGDDQPVVSVRTVSVVHEPPSCASSARVASGPAATAVAAVERSVPAFEPRTWRERRQRDRRDRHASRSGDRLHAALARAVEHAAVAGVESARASLADGPGESLAASELFTRVCALDARAEVPVLDVRSASLRAGRLDVYGVDGEEAVVVDWKSSLPDDAGAALAEHAEQVERYRDVAVAAGARSCSVTLCSADGTRCYTY